MKLSTKALASSLIAAAINALPGRKRPVAQREAARYERILQKHDRKGELRASVLGVTPQEFKRLQKAHSLGEIVHQFGFQDEQSFYIAVVGRIKAELRQRGWNNQRLYRFEQQHLTI